MIKITPQQKELEIDLLILSVRYELFLIYKKKYNIQKPLWFINK